MFSGKFWRVQSMVFSKLMLVIEQFGMWRGYPTLCPLMISLFVNDREIESGVKCGSRKEQPQEAWISNCCGYPPHPFELSGFNLPTLIPHQEAFLLGGSVFLLQRTQPFFHFGSRESKTQNVHQTIVFQWLSQGFVAGGGSGGLVGTPIEFLLKEYEVKLGWQMGGKPHGHANKIRTSWNLFLKKWHIFEKKETHVDTNYQAFDAGGGHVWLSPYWQHASAILKNPREKKKQPKKNLFFRVRQVYKIIVS